MLWWIQRPITPVVLSSKEQAVVEQKIRELEGGRIPLQPGPTPAIATEIAPTPTPEDRPYTPGAKSLRITEREINGLLNQNTDLGERLRFEFGRDAVNAYVAIPIPEDFPIGGGTTFRMRGRFRVSIGGDGEPFAILEDVTVFGLSLPKEWLGGIKGENLLADALGTESGIQGIKSLRVEPGALVIEVND